MRRRAARNGRVTLETFELYSTCPPTRSAPSEVDPLDIEFATEQPTTEARRSRWFGWPLAFLAACTLPFIGLVLFPGTLEGKSLAVLHGLCAQQPTHSFYFGESRLPFDARMTGIYGGFAIASLFLLARGRWRTAGLPSTPVLMVTALLIIPLGIDGLNSTLKDAGLWHPYEPMNALRTLTGLLLGTSLATFIWLLVGQVAFRGQARSDQPIWTGFGELAAVSAIQAVYAALVFTNWVPLRVPLTFALIAAALFALTGLMLALVLLVTRRECQAADTWQLAKPATTAVLCAIALMAAISSSRFALEIFLGLPATPAG